MNNVIKTRSQCFASLTCRNDDISIERQCAKLRTSHRRDLRGLKKLRLRCTKRENTKVGVQRSILCGGKLIFHTRLFSGSPRNAWCGSQEELYSSRVGTEWRRHVRQKEVQSTMTRTAPPRGSIQPVAAEWWMLTYEPVNQPTNQPTK